MIADAAADILSVNHAFTTLTGFTLDEMAGTSLWDIGAGQHDAQFFHEVRMRLEQGGQWRGEFLNRCKLGAPFPAWLSISVVENADRSVSHYVAVFTEVSALKMSEQRLQHLAHHDPLTGLPNRVLFHDRLEQAINRSHRDGSLFALMFLDMDRFKLINDSLGHAVGDRLLQAVASRLKGCLREVDTVARLGGDEFAIILSDLQRGEDATVVAEKMVATLGMPYLLEPHEVFVTPSIGVTIYPEGHVDKARLLEGADVAMYQAKENGRNNFQYYSADMNEAAYERLRTETSLRRALERNEFMLYYQPQMDLQTGAIVGVEALMRWQHPERGRVLPAEFIPILEETGLIIPVGEWVLETACTHFKAWLDAGIAPRRLAVNLSLRQFRHRNLVGTIAGILERTGLSGRHLELEVSESTVMANVQLTVAILERLKVLGIQIAIDDFGTGSSSLSHLKSLPIDTVKIGHPFVLDIPHSRDDAAITAAIISLAQSMRLTSVAEGVETEDQASFLRQQHCDQMQGYLFEKPLPLEAMAEMLRRWASEAMPHAADLNPRISC
ncbi:putative bifunctional diguanylate cyclase/phosphodiesterase [Cupriavidus sp. D39]|uniref:putative bifunctional diguanylate cyclase/phosphodiesterase n=1 Tax=Cupriavidus sp. D39 TaxID=2997877 RepID=UPI0022719E83|nr:GGDEF and EAL domain-containing protein [Cupriavidus sp. D39]MCY0853545.1 EAL domain-containing protein [Cupriavidus sp. D39]